MTNERIAEIKALCEAADSGPWIYKEHRSSVLNKETKIAEIQWKDANGYFIAAARQVIQELLEALELRDSWIETYFRTRVMMVPEWYRDFSKVIYHPTRGGGPEGTEVTYLE